MALLWLLLISKFNSCGNPGQNTGHTVHFDTVYVHIKADTIYKPIPKYVVKEGRVDSFITYERITDTVEIVKDYESIYVYNDTLKHLYGTFTINDSIQYNRIKSRNLITEFTIPEITKTVTRPAKRVSFGAQIGTGLLYNGKVHAGVYGGIGVNVRLSKN